ncbi:ABC transporter substrate-binding protein [Pseudonocardia sp. CA-142604]|uniref:ABC transporter substrate-binding protein n=1 Tax=Pseudonocardia sp. CA-142604 TaxID=3240024 RepID=UPI003D911C82
MIRIPRRYRRALVTFVTVIGLAALVASCGAVQAQGNASGVQTLRAVSPYGGDRAAEGEPQRGGTLRVGMDRDAVSFDPVVPNANQAASVVYDSLLRLTPDGRTEPFVAKSMESPDNGLTWLMGLRPGVKFQDGTDLDANAVVLNVQRHIDTVASPAHRFAERISSMRVVDPLTVEFVLGQPMGEFPTVFALSYSAGTLGMIVSPAALQKYGDAIGTHPVGVGPFTLVEWVRDSRITFTRNQNYWQDGLPYLDGIEFRPLPDTETRFASMKNGDVDFIYGGYYQELSRALGDPNLKVYYGPGSGGERLQFNHVRAPFDDRRMREAIIRAIDLKALSASQYGNQMIPADSLFDASSQYHTQAASDAWPAYDLEKAKQLVEAYRADGGNPDFTFKTSNSRTSFAEFVQAQMAAIGVKVDIQLYDLAQFSSAVMQSGDFQLTTYLGSIDTPYPAVANLLRSGGSGNYGKYSNPEVDQLLDDAMLTTDEAQRTKDYQQVELLSARDLAVGWYSRNYSSNITRAAVNGVYRYMTAGTWFEAVWIKQ